MSRRTIGILVLTVLAIPAAACTKLPTPPPPSVGIPSETLAQSDALPQEWGSLVSATSVAGFPDRVQLWLQDREGNVRMVVYDLPTNQFVLAKLIRRRS